MGDVVSTVWRLVGGGVLALCVRLGVGAALLLGWLAFSAGPAASEPTCTDSWTGGAGTASWSAPENWSSGVPGPSDVACIGSATVQIASGADHARVVQGEGTLEVSGGSLELTDESASSTLGSLSLTGGALSVSGTLDVTSTLTSSSDGTVSGSGRLVVEAGASGSLGASGCSLLTLSGVTFVNEGTTTLGASGGVSGQLDMQEGAHLENTGTFDADSYAAGCVPGSNSAAIQNNGGSPAVSNTGTFDAGVGSGHTALVSVSFSNSGSVHVASGALKASGGGSSTGGTWTAASGSEVGFTGGSFSLSGNTWSGAGTIALAGATVTAASLDATEANVAVGSGSLTIPEGSATTVASLGLTGGTLSVAGTLDVASSLTSGEDATVSGSGHLVVESGASGSLGASGCSLLTLSGVTFVNEGTVTLGASGGVSGQLDMQEGAHLENTGTFDADSYAAGCVPGSNSAAIQNNGGSPTVSNTGTFNAGPGSGHTALVSVPFDDEGTVHVASGALHLMGGGSSTGATWTTASGTEIAFTTGSYSLAGDYASGAKLALSGGTLSVATGTTTLGSLSLAGGTLSVAGTLDVTSSLTSGEDATVSGSGRLVVEAGASGSLGASGCSLLTLSGVTLVNEGTTTLGASGGVSGQLDMQEGAHLENTGTFDADSYAAGCVPGSNSAAIQNNGGSPTVSNTGTFNAGPGSGHTALVSVSFGNDGVVDSRGGTLQFGGGGVPEEVATGGWSKEGGASIVLSAGTFLISEGVDLSAVEVTGATVERVGPPGPPSGSLTALEYAKGTVTVSGAGEAHGLGFVGATIEVTPFGHSEWASLCGLLTPGLTGEFSCSWSTMSGSFPDRRYQLRATLGDSASPPTSTTTSPITVLVDNTPPTGSLSPPGFVDGTAMLSGTASDGGSGVASWQLQISPSGESAWTDACEAQTIPTSGSTYGCAIDTTAYTDDVYDLRAIITDNAGNTYTTTTASTKIDNATLGSSMGAISMAVRGTVSLTGDASSTRWGVASWTPQFKPVGSGSWVDACAVQTTPLSGSEYGCSANTTAFTDGEYEARAVSVDGAGKTTASTTRFFLVDNTPPTGELDALPETVGGTYEVQGLAFDSGSGVASWQLEVTPAGSESWGDACLEQTTPAGGPLFGCDVDVGALTDGSYELRALITDLAGNTYTTPALSMVVDDSPLSLTSAPVISGEAVDGQSLAASTGTWGGGGPVSYAYQWQSCDTAGETCRDIPGANGNHYVLGDGDVGTAIRVLVHATNGVGEDSATSAATAAVSFGTLGDISVPVISGATAEGGTLAVDPGSWRGARPLSFAYEWRKCNTSGAECSTISGATSSSYRLIEGDVGSTLRVVVSAGNGEGSASVTTAASATVTSGSSSGIRYVYDQAGRLSLVDAPEGGAARYSWDSDGNLLSIERFSHSTLAVLAFSPTRAPVAGTVDITGTGFDPDPADDTVKFDGTTATVTSASATDIAASVPSGAGSGAITVTVGEASASSSTSFTPGSPGDALAPSVSGVSPDIAAVGETVTASGSNLLGSPPTTSVTINGLYTSPPAGSSGSLTFTVPQDATSGPVEVGTGHGLTEAGDLFVVPAEYTKGQVGPTARMSFEHASTGTFAAGKIGLFLFTGTKGHNASLHVGGWAMSSEGWVQVSVLAPNGTKIGGSQESFSEDGTDVLEQLPATGTYTVVVAPRGDATGGLSLTPYDAPGVSTTILPASTGGEASLSLTIPGQQGRATFSGRPGERVLIEGSGEGSFEGRMTFSGPAGVSLGSSELNPAGFIDATTLSSNGTYTIDVQGDDSYTGTIALKAYLVPPDLTGTLTPTSEGASKSLTFTTPGQNAVLTFSGYEGENVSLQGSSWSLSDSDSSYWTGVTTYIIAPNGSVLGESGGHTATTNGFYGVQRLPETGTYEIVADPVYATTGSLTLTARKISNIEETLTPTASGASRSLALEVPGQGARLVFSGTPGEKVALALSEWSLSSGALTLSMTSPYGLTVGGSGAWERFYSNGFYEPLTLSSTGTYAINVASTEGVTGTVKLTAYEVSDHTGTIAVNGSPVTTETTTPGQNTLLTFTGHEGETVKAAASEVTIPESHLALLTPSGGTLEADSIGTSGGSFEKTLPATGTYTLELDPDGADTGKATLALSNEDSGEPHARRAPQQPFMPPLGQIQPANTNPHTSPPSQPATNSTAPTTGSRAAAVLPPVACTGKTKAQGASACAITPAKHVTHSSKTRTHPSRRRGAHHAHETPRHRARQAAHPTARHRKTPGAPHNAPTKSTDTASTLAAPATGAGQTSSGTTGPQTATAGVSAVPAAVSDYRSPYTPAWNPTPRNERDGDWVTGRGPSPWSTLPVLAGLPATTGVSGQALVIDGTPLRGVTLTLKGTTVTTKTDSTGRFLLAGLPAGHQVLTVDGATANARGRRYGQFSVGVDLTAGQTTALGYTIWMTPLEPAGNTTINYPLRHLTVLRNPRIPGLEVRLPAGTVVRSADGSAVRQLNVTAIPVDRPPFPLPFANVPTYFTVQPGGAYLNKGAQIVYPNWGHLPPGQRVDFWNYDPTDRGWYIYGKGSVSANGQQVIPDPDVRVWELTGAMISSGDEPGKGPRDGAEKSDGDPVDLATGLFVYHHTDLVLPDSSMPVELTRTYRQLEGNSFSFGASTESPFDIHLWSDENYRSADLVLPNGGTIELRRTSPGTSYEEAVYSTYHTPGEWEGAVMRWNGHGWSLRRRDGTTFFFGVYTGLQGIEDRNGNQITLIREGGPGGPITQIRTPHGRWIDLTYDSYNRITQATDNAGQTVHYEYNSTGDLVKVTDPKGNATHYAYDSTREMTSVTDARGHTLISNTYDGIGDVTEQTVMGHGTYTFSYTPAPFSGGGLYPAEPLSTIVNGPNGRRRVYFKESTLLPTAEQTANGMIEYGRNSEGAVTETYDTRSGKTVRYGYDALGDLTSIKEEPPGQPAATTSLTYNETFSRPTSITDPLGQTTTYNYDSNGNLTQATDPMGLQTTMSYDPEGELTSVTDPQGNTTHYGYAQGDLVSETDPLGNETQTSYDGAGRPISLRNPEGGLTQLAYDEDNNLTSSTDPAGDTTSYAYDEDSDLTGITDPRGHAQTGVYDSQDQLTSWTDALAKTTSYAYNGNGELESVTDPKGQKTSYSYDEQGRLSSVGFGATGGGSPTSTIGYAYDNENEITSVDDSRAGDYTLSYDAFDRLTGVSGPNGSIGYTYNAAGEREGMTLSGETAASYTYNADRQLTKIETPHGNVAMHYDSDGRPAKIELPNSDTETYTYNQDSQLAGIDYENPEGGQIGNLQYTRNPLGQISTTSGSMARTNLPAAVSENTYNADNELSTSEGHTLTYDNDGNLTSDGTSSYAYNDRNQLTEVTQGTNTWDYAYDPFGRRIEQTHGSTHTAYRYDGPNITTELTSGTITARMLNGLGIDEHYARTTSSETSSYLTDQQNSTLALTNEAGTPTTEYTYDPFGAATQTGATTTNPYQYTGLQTDEDGLQNNRARYYNPTTGRFTSQDPAGTEGSGTNLYQYALSDPTNYTDPTGEHSTGERNRRNLRRDSRLGHRRRNPRRTQRPRHRQPIRLLKRIPTRRRHRPRTRYHHSGRRGGSSTR